MRQTLALMSAPTSIQPGGYVSVAYAGRTAPLTPTVEIVVEPTDEAWRISLAWDCPQPVNDASRETDRFVDACAIFAPEVPGAPWITMGAPRMAVHGWLWHADRTEPWQVRAEGLGTMQRAAAPSAARVDPAWKSGRWHVTFVLAEWRALATQRRFALAIWRGAGQERGGLKSVSPDWIALP